MNKTMISVCVCVCVCVCTCVRVCVCVCLCKSNIFVSNFYKNTINFLK